MPKISQFITVESVRASLNMFMVQIPFPTALGGGNDEDVNLLCKSTALPA